MEKHILGSLIALIVFATACGGVQKDESLTGITKHSVIAGSLKTGEDGSINGTATLLFEQTLGTSTDTVVYKLAGSLKDPGSSLGIYSHGADSNLNESVRVIFSRTGDDHVRGSIQVASDPVRVMTTGRLSSVQWNNLALTVEISNDANGVHVVIWPLEAPRQTGASALIDSQVSGHMDSPLSNSMAAGVHLGMRLVNASVTRIQML